MFHGKHYQIIEQSIKMASTPFLKIKYTATQSVSYRLSRKQLNACLGTYHIVLTEPYNMQVATSSYIVWLQDAVIQGNNMVTINGTMTRS